jgi:hypothetical protein
MFLTPLYCTPACVFVGILPSAMMHECLGEDDTRSPRPVQTPAIQAVMLDLLGWGRGTVFDFIRASTPLLTKSGTVPPLWRAQ